MGCSSSVLAGEPSTSKAGISRKSSLICNGDSAASSTSVARNFNSSPQLSIDRRLSMLTLKSGRVRSLGSHRILTGTEEQSHLEETPNNEPETAETFVHSAKVSETKNSSHSPEIRSRDCDNDSWKSEEVTAKTLSNKRLASSRLMSLSVPTSPLVTARIKNLRETDGKPSSLSMHDENNSVEGTQALLNEALRELSRSLSGSHGSVFHVEYGGLESSHPKNQDSPSLETINRLNSEERSSPYSPKSNVVVLNIGSGFCKAGFANDDMPSVVFPTVVGRPRSVEALPGVSANTMFVGKDAKLRKDSLNFSRPVKKGEVVNWEELQAIVEHILRMELQIDEQDISVVLPVSVANREEREKLVKMMFDKIGVSSLYLGSSAPMALHAFGMSSGLVVNIGHDVTSCVPVYHGNVLREGVRYLNIGGSDITQRLKDLMLTETSKYVFEDDDIARAMMERLCFVANEEGNNVNEKKMERTYSLPNENVISLDKERFLAAEILFRPSGDNIENAGQKRLQHICSETIDACRDLNGTYNRSSESCENIVLTGGSSLLPGLSQRLQSELKNLHRNSEANDIRIHALPKRQYAVWRGAGQMASLGLSKGRWISKQEYEGHGASVVHRKYI